MRVLVVEDDAAVAGGIIDGLALANFESRLVTTGRGCLDTLPGFAPDLILLDLGLPDMDGTDVCRAIRRDLLTPIIVVSARSDEIDRVVVLEMGADDFVVKPFGMRELVARMRAVVRRTGAADAGGLSQTKTFGPLSVDLRAQKEFELLVYLSQDPGAVFRRSEILHNVWDTNWYGTTKTLDTHIASIRKKLGDPRWIESVWGVGFRFEVPT
jgi:DNA-binding response OmpR family regulator